MSDFNKLVEWANFNKSRGCTRDSMKETAVSQGWNSDFIDSVLSTVFNDGNLIVVSNNVHSVSQLEKIPEPDISGGKPYVITSDRKIPVLLSVRHPRIVVFQNFLSNEECDELVILSKNLLTRSEGFNLNTGSSEVSDARTSSGTFFRRGFNDLIQRIDVRVSEACNWPVMNTEDMQVLHYQNGEQYVPHHDFFHEEFEGSKSVLQRGGQRVATLIMYLNDPEEGGATEFPETGIRIEAKKGSALFFSYPIPNASTKTLHSGTPVTKGEKFVATKWFRQREFI